MLGNEGCMDAVNVSVAFQKLAAACCAISPVGETQTSGRRMFQKLVSMALNLQGSFKLDPLNMTLGALARLSSHPSSNLMPPSGTDEAFNIQVIINIPGCMFSIESKLCFFMRHKDIKRCNRVQMQIYLLTQWSQTVSQHCGIHLWTVCHCNALIFCMLFIAFCSRNGSDFAGPFGGFCCKGLESHL